MCGITQANPAARAAIAARQCGSAQQSQPSADGVARPSADSVVQPTGASGAVSTFDLTKPKEERTAAERMAAKEAKLSASLIGSTGPSSTVAGGVGNGGGIVQTVVAEAVPATPTPTPTPAPTPAPEALPAATQSYIAEIRQRIAGQITILNQNSDKLNNLSGRISNQELRLDRLRTDIVGTSGDARARIQANIADAKLNIANLRELYAAEMQANARIGDQIDYLNGLIAPYGG